MITEKDLEKLPERIRKKFIVKNECWVWTGHRNRQQYGAVYWNKTSCRAHRVVYEILVGKIPPGKLICHKCDNPPCVNPDHLFVGTQVENIQDSLKKGRHANKIKTHCRRGHEYNEENTKIKPANGHRVCIECRKISRNALRKIRRKEKIADEKYSG